MRPGPSFLEPNFFTIYQKGKPNLIFFTKPLRLSGFYHETNADKYGWYIGLQVTEAQQLKISFK